MQPKEIPVGCRVFPNKNQGEYRETKQWQSGQSLFRWFCSVLSTYQQKLGTATNFKNPTTPTLLFGSPLQMMQKCLFFLIDSHGPINQLNFAVLAALSGDTQQIETPVEKMECVAEFVCGVQGLPAGLSPGLRPLRSWFLGLATSMQRVRRGG